MAVLWRPDFCGDGQCVLELGADGLPTSIVTRCVAHASYTSDAVLQESRLRQRAREVAATALGVSVESIETERDGGSIVLQLPRKVTKAVVSGIRGVDSRFSVTWPKP